MRTSKSKTFEKQSEIGDVIDFVIAQVETEDREIIYNGAEPSMDVKIETSHKYIVTITKVEENG
jgi:hypothetical protein